MKTPLSPQMKAFIQKMKRIAEKSDFQIFMARQLPSPNKRRWSFQPDDDIIIIDPCYILKKPQEKE
jgi:hypothetical protein